MRDKVYENWPDYAELSRHGEQSSIRDDLGRSSMTVSVLVPYWTERAISASDSKTGQYADLRFFCPLAGGGQSRHTLRAVYNMQGAMLQDVAPQLVGPRQTTKTSDSPVYTLTRSGDGGRGSLSVHRVNRNWLGLTVTDQDFDRLDQETEPPSAVTLFFNRMRSPAMYAALLALGQAIRRDNKHYPIKSRDISPPTA